MSEINFWEKENSYLFKTGDSNDFVSPASQDVLLRWQRPLWKPSHESRAPFPFWQRPEIFRTVDYSKIFSVRARKESVYTGVSFALPSGELAFENVYKPVKITSPDWDLYHHNVQKIFSLFCQFDILTEYQVSGFTGLSLEEVSRCCKILHSAGVLLAPNPPWFYHDTLGQLWIANLHDEASYNYQKGMDSLLNLFAFGGYTLDDMAPPGTGARAGYRHNLYGAEIMLRIAETCDNVVGVWGDLFTSEALFHTQDPLAKQRNSHGDGVAVTKDGSLIIFEFVGAKSSSNSAFHSLANKAASWVGVIASSDLDINVVFMDMSFTKDQSKILGAIDYGVREVSKGYAPLEYLRERALNHIGLINLSYWYPDDHTVSRAETRLLAYDMFNHDYRCFDEPDDNFSDSEKRKNVIINTMGSLHNPSWIRDDFKPRKF